MDNLTVDQPISTFSKQQRIKKIQSYCSYGFGGLEVLLVIRFFFRLLGANTASPFVNFLYQVTYPFISIFQGIFKPLPAIGATVVEVETLVAVIMYGLMWFGVLQLVRTLMD